MQRSGILVTVGFVLLFAGLQPGLLLGEKAKDAPKADQEQIRKLVRQLGDDDFKRREHASKKLVEIGPAALPELEKSVKNADAEVGARAKACVQTIKDRAAIPGLIEKLGDAKLHIQVNAERELMRIGGDAVPALRKALKDKNKDVRGYAAGILMYLREKAVAAVPDLIEALDDQELRVAVNSAVGLGYMGQDAKIAIPKLLRIYKDEKKAERFVFALGIHWAT